ncbi:MAG: hypothetical protein HZC50_09635 [Nitrospirae bacterium]|nr:hypothetical protein [Nitrospirota bacterium]
MLQSIIRPVSEIDEPDLLSVEHAATARWLCDLDLRQRFLTLPDYLQRVQLMRLGMVPLDATLFL